MIWSGECCNTFGEEIVRDRSWRGSPGISQRGIKVMIKEWNKWKGGIKGKEG